MRILKVGGCVRDHLMQREPKDIDYVVIGATTDQMLNAGFTCVGKKFPVFLHPVTGDEHALARKEVSTGSGSYDFECFTDDVTLEEDLYRRDFTINAMAMEDDGTIIDPYNGVGDLTKGLLNPVSVHFLEDPLRVIRAARFLARYPHLQPSSKLKLYCSMMADKVFDLPKDRLWKELERVLTETSPSRFFEFLEQFGLMPEHTMLKFVEERNAHHPEDNVFEHTKMAVDRATFFETPAVTLATALHDFGKIESYAKYGKGHGHENMGFDLINAFLLRWGVPSRIRETVRLTAKFHSTIHQCAGRNGQGRMTPKKVAFLFGTLQSKHSHGRLLVLLATCIADAKGRGKTTDDILEFANRPYTQPDYILRCLDIYSELDTRTVADQARAKRNETAYILEQITHYVHNALKRARNNWEEPTHDSTPDEVKRRLHLVEFI